MYKVKVDAASTPFFNVIYCSSLGLLPLSLPLSLALLFLQGVSQSVAGSYLEWAVQRAGCRCCCCGSRRIYDPRNFQQNHQCCVYKSSTPKRPAAAWESHGQVNVVAVVAQIFSPGSFLSTPRAASVTFSLTGVFVT